jgi:hypothetical protein
MARVLGASAAAASGRERSHQQQRAGAQGELHDLILSLL